jgi:two-component system OmpR family response regulator
MLKVFESNEKTERARILVVDDEPDLVSAIQCRLEWCKCEVVTAGNGREGLDKAASEKPDLILLDAGMPVMNGLEMLERLRKDPRLWEVPVIMCTSPCEARDIGAALSLGITDCVTKPFDYAQLMDKIANILQDKNLN